MATEIIMPQLGEGVIEGTISNWLKKEGDWVEQFEPILEIETDKVTTEATAEVAGKLLKILIPEGATVEVGTTLAYIGGTGEQTPVAGDDVTTRAPESSSDEAKLEPAPVATQTRNARPAGNGAGSTSVRRYTGRISPVVGRIAEEHSVDLNLVTGTGRDGRITKKDILAYVKVQQEGIVPRAVAPALSPSSPIPSTPGELPQPLDPSPSPVAVPGEILALTGMRRSIAEHMVRSKQTSPHVTAVWEIDFTTVAAHRKANKDAFARDGVNLTFTAYVVSAIVQALKAHPLVNSSWSDEGIVLKKEINVGVATAIPDGLIVPVVRNADGLSLLGLARTVNDLSSRARDNQLRPDEVQGGTFTLTNHGVSGSLFAAPIINQPQCAIMGLGKIEKRVKVINDAIAIRLMAYASLTFDHRILDGASGDAFMAKFKDALEGWK